MAEDLMRYDLMAQEALRGVIRRALEVAQKKGLPGEHHFYISLRTDAPGVEISEKLRKQYPEEITIVLQHQFWNLEVREDGFSVDLTFNKIPETLVVPYSAVQAFFDPSVQFGLQFEVAKPEGAPAPTEAPKPTPEKDEQPSSPGDSAVVSLDAFRKK
ncbi:MAG TPA: ClpXP protease specificity-enhancing factor SspB [Parvibaculum sp.]|uniref:SspB family protein n=1 Tax=Parvibaculum sp. TaxID=2024848 RepID=UPI002C9F38B5|nr:ClpXP protease specificity-enhancing factor SspB [Parvibaculum sp.]HMM13831.1 ClpXP protease specificity-enhancing factor SspB [Parvibaculum sp.]